MNKQLPTRRLNRALSKRRGGVVLVAFAAMLSLLFAAQPANATHSWGGYHWARTSNPFVVQLGNNLSNNWQAQFSTAMTDWSASDVLNTVIAPNAAKPNRTCRATLGRVEVCNSKYGSNGWLGLAQIWITADGHITQGTTKMNDTYFNTAAYNNTAEKNHVMCQEIGHTVGLGHQDETGAALGTCMDYSSDIGSQHPNAHDYEELDIIYAHLDSSTTLASTTASAAELDTADHDNRQNMGRRVFRSGNGRLELYQLDFQDGSSLLSSVYLAE